jgi:hypothetical protein
MASMLRAPRARATETRWWPSRIAYASPTWTTEMGGSTVPRCSAIQTLCQRVRAGAGGPELAIELRRPVGLDGPADRVERDLAHSDADGRGSRAQGVSSCTASRPQAAASPRRRRLNEARRCARVAELNAFSASICLEELMPASVSRH